jgi:hypothetical protein
VQHGSTGVKAEQSELAGLPDDYLAGHPAAPSGAITIGTSSPEVTPVFDYCQE